MMTEQKPEVACRCCGKVLDADWQPGLASRHGYYLLTCRHEDCDLFGFTLGHGEYANLDLTDYLESGRRRRR